MKFYMRLRTSCIAFAASVLFGSCSSDVTPCDDIEQIAKVIKLESVQSRLKVTKREDNFFLEMVGSENRANEFILLANNTIPDSIWLDNDTLRVVYGNLSLPSKEETLKGLLEYHNLHHGKLDSYIVVHEIDNREFTGSHASMSQTFDSISVNGNTLTFINEGNNIGKVHFNELTYMEGAYSVDRKIAESDVLRFQSFEPTDEELKCEVYQNWINW
ncbi:hypothetical protein [Phaeocystidibacter luteus]|uniref:Uncharacterized protein n=1 Tax=Phaeocystidibacter luteus TaxID=911197 RepID=A0A6N6RG29_9FLAO|nr:hypothetical protein [Phaeocystidibacter luteus]KAB2807056.1 hypothetical protein F8C67_12745 [Phaeocystidibacter luteus]